MKRPILVLSLTLLSFSALNIQGAMAKTAAASITSADNKMKGDLTLEDTDKGVKVSASFTGLAPGSVHGIHVHEKGMCEPPKFESAGGHFNPGKMKHGEPGAPEHHVGDFGNIVADAKGNARKELIIPNEHAQGLDIFVEKAVIVHVNPDDLVSQPTGNAGDRLMCGVIKLLKN